MSGSTGELERQVLEWQYMRGPEFAKVDRSRAVVCVTCSPLEVHGPHLPMITDNWEAECLTGRIIELMHDRHPELIFLRLPPIYVASDVVPQAGSVKFRSSTIIRVLSDLGRSLSRQGFKHIWVASFHGGPRHFVPLEVACDQTNRRYGTKMVSLFSLLINRLTSGSSDLSEVFGGLEGITKDDLKGDSHGGAVETSMMLHLLGEHVDPGYKELEQRTVDMKLKEQGRAPLQKKERPSLWELLRGFKYKLRYYETDTYAGKPAVSSAELGKEMVDVLAAHSVEALEELWNGKLPLSECHSPLWPMRWFFTNPLFSWCYEKVAGFRSEVW